MAFRINEAFYKHVHYVWCTPYFEAGAAPPLHAVPPSSTPRSLYWDYLNDLSDYNSSKIGSNGSHRTGLKHGANAKVAQGVITAPERDALVQTIDKLPPSEFRPILYVIPFELVAGRGLLRKVPVGAGAHPFSTEYIIDELPRSCFDAIILEK